MQRRVPEPESYWEASLRKDFINLKTELQFDLIVANPPYAKLLSNGKRASKNHNLIGLFINKSFGNLKVNFFL